MAFQTDQIVHVPQVLVIPLVHRLLVVEQSFKDPVVPSHQLLQALLTLPVLGVLASRVGLERGVMCAQVLVAVSLPLRLLIHHLLWVVNQRETPWCATLRQEYTLQVN